MQEDKIVKDSITFVDDRTLYTNGGDEEEIREKIKDNVTTVQNLLSATGGALNLMKSSYAIIGEEKPSDATSTLLIPRPKCEQEQIASAFHTYITSPNSLTGHKLQTCIGSKIPETPTDDELQTITRYIDQAPLRQSLPNDSIRSLGFWYSPDGKIH